MPAGTPRDDLGPGASRALRLAIIYTLIFLIALADALTPAGVVVGILMGIPILLASLFEGQRHVLAAAFASVLCYVLAALLGSGPMSPEVIWIPNRVLALLSILALSWIALEFQRRRRELEAARAAAESALDLNRLLHSLMAHDLRSPLVLARQGFDIVRSATAAGAAPDLALVGDVDNRLDRSLRTIELVLEAARSELDEQSEALRAAAVPIERELQEEIDTFRADAGAHDKQLELQVAPRDLVVRVNGPVLRQGVAILVDNAIRHAVPGRVAVLAQPHGTFLWVHVRDQGPGLGAHSTTGPGSGIGLRLCRLLAERAGGSLDVVRDGPEGTELVLRLPTHPN